jgi:hypothetical protein
LNVGIDALASSFSTSEPVLGKLIERIAKFRGEEAVQREESKLAALRKR